MYALFCYSICKCICIVGLITHIHLYMCLVKSLGWHAHEKYTKYSGMTYCLPKAFLWGSKQCVACLIIWAGYEPKVLSCACHFWVLHGNAERNFDAFDGWQSLLVRKGKGWTQVADESTWRFACWRTRATSSRRWWRSGSPTGRRLWARSYGEWKWGWKSGRTSTRKEKRACQI